MGRFINFICFFLDKLSIYKIELKAILIKKHAIPIIVTMQKNLSQSIQVFNIYFHIMASFKLYNNYYIRTVIESFKH